MIPESTLSVPEEDASTGGSSATSSASGHVPPALMTLSAAAVVALLFYPVLAFAISVCILLNARLLTTALRRTLALTAVVAISLIGSSRPIAGTAVQDIVGYYDVYLNLRAGDLTELLHYGAGLEVAMPLLFYLWGLMLPKLTVNGLMLCLCLTASGLFVGWIESTFYSRKRPLASPMLFGFAIVLLNVYFATQLSRQFVSGIVLLFAFSATKRWRSFAWLLLATAFHLTAVPFYLAYVIATRTRYGIPLLVIAALVLRFSFAGLLANIDAVPDVAADKLNYYADNADADASPDLASLRFIGLLCFLSLSTFVASRFRLRASERPWAILPWVAAAIYVILLPIPLLSLRFTLLVHSVLTGLIAFRIGERFRLALLLLGNALIAYKAAGYFGFYDARTGMSTLEAIARSFVS